MCFVWEMGSFFLVINLGVELWDHVIDLLISYQDTFLLLLNLYSLVIYCASSILLK